MVFVGPLYEHIAATGGAGPPLRPRLLLTLLGPQPGLSQQAGGLAVQSCLVQGERMQIEDLSLFLISTGVGGGGLQTRPSRQIEGKKMREISN